MVRAAPGVRIRDGFRLASYRFGHPSGSSAWGVTYAVEGESIHHPSLSDESKEVPCPEGAVERLDPVLIPDDGFGPWFTRSLLIRELCELGAYWHGVRWHAHEPCFSADDVGDLTSTGDWSWKDRTVAWPPTVELGPLSVTVRFATYSGLGHKTLHLFSDVHALQDGTVDMSDTLLASDGIGWIP